MKWAVTFPPFPGSWTNLPLRMNLLLRLSLGVLLATPFLSASARIERVVEKSFTAPSAGVLRLETQGGEIRVMPSSDRVVHITARQSIRASTEAEADEMLKHLDLAFEQTGNDVRATARYDKARGFFAGVWPPVKVDFIVTVPADFATELRTSGGAIEVGNLQGRVDARTSGGSIKLATLGGAVDARTSGGSITLTEARGPVKLETSGGNITVGRVLEGPADLSTSGGGIRIDAVENLVRARTSGGSVQAGITGSLREDCVLSTSGGSVRVAVAKGAAFRLDASTSGGRVDADGLTLTLDGNRTGRSQLSGTVNGGGPVLKLRSSGGNITVRAS
jgi:hypothetical protein